jgi:hypothetical protein
MMKTEDTKFNNSRDFKSSLEMTEISAFCRGCGYALTGLRSGLCPECGRVFSWSEPATFTRGRRQCLPRILRRLLVAAILSCLGYSALIGACYLAWNDDAEARGALDQNFGTTSAPVTVGWKNAFIPNQLAFLRERTVTVARFDNPVDARQMAAIGRMRHLRVLKLERTTLTDGQLSQMLPKPALEELSLAENSISDVGLEQLQHSGNLTHLDISRTDAEGGSYLSRMPNLRTIFASRSRFSDSGIRHMRQASMLHSINISDTKVTDAGIVELPLANLMWLSANDTSVTDNSCRWLAAHAPRLTSLGLSGTSVTDRGIEHVAGLQNLLDLAIMDCEAVTDASVPHLLRLRSLRHLNICRTKVSRLGTMALRAGLPLTEILD